MQSFFRTKGGTTFDASCLLAPLVRFIGTTDPRWLSTLKLIEERLVDDSLVYRYRTEDGLIGSEGTFCMCSFSLGWFSSRCTFFKPGGRAFIQRILQDV